MLRRSRLAENGRVIRRVNGRRVGSVLCVGLQVHFVATELELVALQLVALELITLELVPLELVPLELVALYLKLKGPGTRRRGNW